MSFGITPMSQAQSGYSGAVPLDYIACKLVGVETPEESTASKLFGYVAFKEALSQQTTPPSLKDAVKAFRGFTGNPNGTFTW